MSANQNEKPKPLQPQTLQRQIPHSRILQTPLPRGVPEEQTQVRRVCINNIFRKEMIKDG